MKAIVFLTLLLLTINETHQTIYPEDIPLPYARRSYIVKHFSDYYVQKKYQALVKKIVVTVDHFTLTFDSHCNICKINFNGFSEGCGKKWCGGDLKSIEDHLFRILMDDHFKFLDRFYVPIAYSKKGEWVSFNKMPHAVPRDETKAILIKDKLGDYHFIDRTKTPNYPKNSISAHDFIESSKPKNVKYVDGTPSKWKNGWGDYDVSPESQGNLN